jgi:hypothetical protein
MPQPGERLDRAEGTKPYREESRALDPREVTIKPGWNVRDMTSPATRLDSFIRAVDGQRLTYERLTA